MNDQQIDSPEGTTRTYTIVHLCSTFSEEFNLVCDEPLGHKGAHRASVFWGGGEDDVRGEIEGD